jgi:hypothetical protein
MEDNLPCSSCKANKPKSDFNKNKGRPSGYSHLCRICSLEDLRKWRSENLKKYLLQRAKYRASQKKIDFNLEVNDLEIPEHCPVFNTKLEVNGDKWSSPSIDRIDNNQGYIKGNIRVISYRANILRHTGSLSEFEQLVKYLKEN